MSLVFEFFFGAVLGFAAQGPPSVADVGDDEWNAERYDTHGLEGEFARRRVVDRQRRLHIGQRRIVGGIVPSGRKQQGEHREDRSRSAQPDRLAATAPAQPDTPENQRHTRQKPYADVGHGQQIVQVFIRFRSDDSRRRIDTPTLGEEQAYEEYEEKHEECSCGAERAAARAFADLCVVDVVHEVVERQHPREEQHGQSQRHIAVVEHRFESVPGSRPLRDRGVAAQVGHVEPIDGEIRTREECADSGAQEDRSEKSVDLQEPVESLFSEYVIGFAPVFVRNGLQDEDQQNQHPDVKRSAETGRVEKRERGEKRAAESYQRSEREFPFAAQRIDDQVAFVFRTSDGVEQALAALHEEQEDQQSSQQGDQEPPVVLQQCQSIHNFYSFQVRS